MQDIKIRHSEDSDIPCIKAIYEGPNAYSGTLQLPHPSLKKWESRLQTSREGFYSLVAVQGNEIIGQIGFDISPNPRRKHVGYIGMAVKDAHQGKGVGNKLLEAVIDLADNWLNLKRIELSVFTENNAAVHLYKKHGFTIEGESPAYAFRNGDYASVYHMGRVI